MRLIESTTCSNPVGRFKHSGTGENDAGNLLSGRGVLTVPVVRESLKNSDFPPAQGCAGKIDRAKRLIL